MDEETWKIEYFKFQFVLSALEALATSRTMGEAIKKVGRTTINDSLDWMRSQPYRQKLADTVNHLHNSSLSVTGAIRTAYASEAREVFDLVVLHLEESIERGALAPTG